MTKKKKTLKEAKIFIKDSYICHMLSSYQKLEKPFPSK